MGCVSVGLDMTMGHHLGHDVWQVATDVTAVCASEVMTEDQGTQLEEG